eukprot:351836-Chlamydomonas_euryale.AAC.1
MLSSDMERRCQRRSSLVPRAQRKCGRWKHTACVGRGFTLALAPCVTVETQIAGAVLVFVVVVVAAACRKNHAPSASNNADGAWEEMRTFGAHSAV